MAVHTNPGAVIDGNNGESRELVLGHTAPWTYSRVQWLLLSCFSKGRRGDSQVPKGPTAPTP